MTRTIWAAIGIGLILATTAMADDGGVALGRGLHVFRPVVDDLAEGHQRPILDPLRVAEKVIEFRDQGNAGVGYLPDKIIRVPRYSLQIESLLSFISD